MNRKPIAPTSARKPVPAATTAEAALIELRIRAAGAGDAEGRVPGIGDVTVTRVAPPRRRGGPYVRRYTLNGAPVAGASLAHAARVWDAHRVIVNIPPL